MIPIVSIIVKLVPINEIQRKSYSAIHDAIRKHSSNFSFVYVNTLRPLETFDQTTSASIFADLGVFTYWHWLN